MKELEYELNYRTETDNLATEISHVLVTVMKLVDIYHLEDRVNSEVVRTLDHLNRLLEDAENKRWETLKW